MRDGVGIGIGNARLNQMKTGDALVVEHRDLSIENCRVAGHLMGQDGQFGILALAAQTAARGDADVLVVQKNQGANPVPFHLVQPIFSARRLVGQGCQHGVQRARHIGLACAFDAGKIDPRFALFLHGSRHGRRRGRLGAALRRRAGSPHPLGIARRVALSLASRQIAGDFRLRAP